jgi:S1-C subfamily serine protease
MKIILILATVLAYAVSAKAQNVLTRKEIYRINCRAVVQINVGDTFGTGFIVSSDGVIFTANHVVTTRESGFKKYGDEIKVAVNGKAAPYAAKPISPDVSDDQVNYDSAVLKIVASNLPHVTLGDWSGIDVGDAVTIIPSFPQMGCVMLEGTVSSKGSALTPLGPKPVDTILFQSPVRNGFSGSPIFDSKGRVVGIEDTKVFGISSTLDSLRTKWKEVSKGGTTIVGGGSSASLPDSFVELIDNLDQNLISGLGSGVDIGYAKREQEIANQQKK